PNDDDGNNLSNYQAGAFYQLLQADSVTSIQFSMAENDDLLENNTVTLVLYQVNCDVFGDEACQNNFDDSQLTAVGVAFYTFTTDDENFDIITVDLLDFNTFGAGPLPVEAGIYFAMVDVAQGTTNPLLFTSVSDPGYSSEQIFSAVRFSPTDQPIGPGSDAIWRLEGFGPEAGIVMRLGVTGDGINTSILDPEELPAELSIFPSPANELLTVDVRLETPATNATVRIVDLMGRTIESRLFDNLNREVMTFDVSSLPAGTYIFNVTTAKGV
ncbi:MAG: T9SS type A sorting domain-containing protein, partial [Bacteroidota bacterium]